MLSTVPSELEALHMYCVASYGVVDETVSVLACA